MHGGAKYTNSILSRAFCNASLLTDRVGDVTLAFDGFEVVSLVTALLLLNFFVVDTKVH